MFIVSEARNFAILAYRYCLIMTISSLLVVSARIYVI